MTTEASPLMPAVTLAQPRLTVWARLRAYAIQQQRTRAYERALAKAVGHEATDLVALARHQS